MIGRGSEQGSAGPHRDEILTDDVLIRSAATVVLLDDRPDLHVLALRRTDASTFVAGHGEPRWFPRCPTALCYPHSR